ncbi:hypothetical protein MmiAt1_08960 [Methanimicrococcus sp. At1]|uniref:Uncharacterized protein n=1 Tax=Methanimicrococcus hacksteinii TaxID=3028293 RepID=A0ABU3VPI5_9EURY|nr:hypothetical protein [Methanimicrococcus sp. At1]MDV0445322.1 hypothetical protein [Methanimicrococcus sp. At1]
MDQKRIKMTLIVLAAAALGLTVYAYYEFVLNIDTEYVFSIVFLVPALTAGILAPPRLPKYWNAVFLIFICIIYVVFLFNIPHPGIIAGIGGCYIVYLVHYFHVKDGKIKW